jgi:hypothetical protein
MTPATGECKNIGLNAMWHTTARWVGAMTASAAVAVEGSAIGHKVKKTAHGLKNGEVIYFSVVSGGAGVVALRPYYVIEEAANEFGISLTEGGSAVSWTTELKSASEYIKLTEMSGGGYKRIETKFEAAAEGKTEDTTEHSIKIPAGKTINAEGYNEAESGAGANKHWLGFSVLTTAETYGSEGTYVVKSSESDMNLAEGTPAP